MHELATLKPVPSAISVKGVSALCVDERGGRGYRLCVGSRRKLHLYEWSRGGEYALVKELSLPDTPLALAWHGSTVCVGYKREYNLLDVDR